VQAAREWYQKLCASLLTLGFEQCKNDPCLFFGTNQLEGAIFCVYVDDFFAVGDKLALEDTIEELNKDFILQVNKNADEYLGCRIEKNKDIITVLSQPDILKQLRNRFWDSIKYVRQHSNPSTTGFKATRVKNDWKKISDAEQTELWSGVGILLHLAKYT